jgi:predicted secreted hydrolase
MPMTPWRYRAHFLRGRRRLPAAGLAVGIGIALLGAGVLAPAARAGTTTTTGTAAVSLPADEGPHSSASTEWWYFTGHLTGTDIDGKKHSYGFEDVAVRSNLLDLEPALALYNGQFAVTDLTRGTFSQYTLNDTLTHDVDPPGGGYDITINGWNMHGASGQNHLYASDGDYSLNLSLDQSQPAALHGTGGLIPYGPFGTSYYYSETNLKVSGTVIDHGVPVTVTGTAWQDHQWGDFTGPGGWTWFALQLSNGTQYMLYFIKDPNGDLAQVVATKVNADGTYEAVPASEVSEVPSGSWTSSATGNTYPQEWAVTVPGGQLTVTSLLPDQEVTNIAVQNYWEGDSSITGTVDGQPVTGKAYVEVQPTFTVPQPGSIGSLL